MRRQLLAWFRTKATPLADAYEGAINLIEDGEFPGRIPFIAHAVRDIADRLVFVLDPQCKSSRVQYENTLDQIQKLWPDTLGIRGMSGHTATDGSVEIDYKLVLLIDKLVQDHRERRLRPSHYDLLFRYLMRSEPFKATVNQRLVDDFKKMRKWFMSLTHLRADGVPEVNEDELHQQFYRFETMLHSFVGDFFTGSAELDDILRQTNQRTD